MNYRNRNRLLVVECVFWVKKFFAIHFNHSVLSHFHYGACLFVFCESKLTNFSFIYCLICKLNQPQYCCVSVWLYMFAEKYSQTFTSLQTLASFYFYSSFSLCLSLFVYVRVCRDYFSKPMMLLCVCKSTTKLFHAFQEPT